MKTEEILAIISAAQQPQYGRRGHYKAPPQGAHAPKGFSGHNPTWMPPKSKLTPAQWKRKRRGQPAPYNYPKGRQEND